MEGSVMGCKSYRKLVCLFGILILVTWSRTRMQYAVLKISI